MLAGKEGNRLSNLLQSREAKGFGLGVGAAVLGFLFWPVIKRSARPVTKVVVAGAMAAGDRVRTAVAELKEGLEDVVAEAQFERMKESMEPGEKGADVPGQGGLREPSS